MGEDDGVGNMSEQIEIHRGVIRPSLIAELESFHAPGQRVSSYYLDVPLPRGGDLKEARAALLRALARERREIDRLDATHAVRQALLHDLEEVENLAPTVIGERHTHSLACFVASDRGFGRILLLPWPMRHRAFFEERFVLWPLQQILDQSDRYAIALTDKDDARLFLFFQERIEEVTTIKDEIPGRIRYPGRSRELEYSRKHVEAYHDHFERVGEAAFRLLRREPFEHLIIGGLWETLPQFEGRLHRYLRDRVVARWDIDVQHTPTPRIEERARQEEQQFLENEARDVWNSIQDLLPQRGALGPDEVFAALWQRRVQTLLVEPDATRPGFRCSVCGRLSLKNGPCVECGGQTAEVGNAYEEAVHDAIEQLSQVRYWKDPALKHVDSIAAFRRY
jgi:peptide subunit release factor 1 (eRF1)